ncbi:MAG: hypothetical protein ACK5HP_00975 [Bacilli bacterium]
MACANTCTDKKPEQKCGNGYIYIIVLYILLAIIIGSLINC